MTHDILLVARQTYRVRVKTFGFWALVLSPLFVPLIGLLVGWIVSTGGSDKTPNLAIVAQPTLYQTLQKADLIKAKLSAVDTVDTAKRQLKQTKIDGYLRQTNQGYQLVTSADTAVMFNETKIQSALTQIELGKTAQQLKLTAADISRLQTPARLTVKAQSNKGAATGGKLKNTANYVIASAIGIFIFIILSVYVGLISQEIANEKSSRIMEILLATTSTRVQYYGKILGIFSLLITQIMIYIIGFIGMLIGFKDNAVVKQIKPILVGIDMQFLIFSSLMFIVGVVGYLFVATIFASLVNEQSQVQQATQPVIYLAMVGYIMSFAVSSAPTNIILKGLSFVPFISPTLMPSRFAVEYAQPWEAWLSLSLEVLAVIVIAKFGEKLYAKNVLSYSDDRIIKQFWRNLRRKL
ncbi:ABC transporter permease [Weissella soli]|uniref:ABC transporter permease n=1 Tax=Weissella soli TaxID=155866 RepID=UPI0035A163AA